VGVGCGRRYLPGGDEMYKVRFLGTQTEYIIEASTMKDAKWIFAIRNGINSIARISAKKIKSS